MNETLSLAKSTLFKNASELKSLEKELEAVVKETLETDKNELKLYNQSFRTNRALEDCVSSTYQKLSCVARFPAQVPIIFKKIIENVHQELSSKKIDDNIFLAVANKLLQAPRNSQRMEEAPNNLRKSAP